jgi:hypothetical protein
VTQTIIINNPNININYLNDSKAAAQNGPMSSRGLDSWNLNNNLKEVPIALRSSARPGS